MVHELRQCVASKYLPIFTSDGLNLYFYALTTHFGQWVEVQGRRRRQWQVVADLLYGQVGTLWVKTYRRRKVTHVVQLMRGGTHAELTAALQALGLRGRLTTAFVEWVNLTIRQSVAALVCRTYTQRVPAAQDAPQLLAHLYWWQAYYHFVRPHLALCVVLAQPLERSGRRQPQRYRQRTPAMAAGLTNRRWTVRELLALPLPPPLIGAG